MNDCPLAIRNTPEKFNCDHTHTESTLSGSVCQRPWHAPAAGHTAGNVLRRDVGIPPFSSQGRQLRAGRGNGRDLKWSRAMSKNCASGVMLRRLYD